MNKVLGFLKSKTVWGTVLYAGSLTPWGAPFAGILQPAGIALGGVGVAHKLDKIKDALTSNDQ